MTPIRKLRPTIERMTAGVAITLAGALALLGVALPAAAATNTIVSAPGIAPVTGAAGSYAGSFSPDGRHLIFVSHANNLVTNDDNAPFLDLFVRDLSSEMTVLISVGTNGHSGGNDNSPFATMSTNGLIAFESRASNLATNDTNGLSDVFVRNLVDGTTTLVSVNSNRTASARGSSTAPLISQDGRRVVFGSTANNLIPGDTNLFADLFVRDRVARTTALVSLDATNAGFAAGPSESASASADGRYVAFVKRATNIIAGTWRSEGEIYVRDLDLGTTTWASGDVRTNFPAWIGFSYWCESPVISADGRYVAFFAEGMFTPAGPVSGLFRYDRVSGTTLRLAVGVTNAFGIPMSADGHVLAWIAVGWEPSGNTGLRVWEEVEEVEEGEVAEGVDGAITTVCLGNDCATSPVLFPDGRRLAYFTNSGPASPRTLAGLAVFDRTTGGHGIVGVTTNGDAALPTAPSVPAISPDGQRLSFETEDPRLSPGDLNQASDVFVNVLGGNTSLLVSAAAPELPPASATGLSTLGPGALSADGRHLVFSALDGNLVPGDTNQLSDIFVRDLLTGGLVVASARTVPGPGGSALVFQTDEASVGPVISGDGRVVVYRRGEPWLASGGALYWRDLGADQPVPIFSNGEVRPANTVALSHDGNVVVFDSGSAAGTLVPPIGGDFNGGPDVFLRDVASGTNALVSVNRAGTGAGNGVSIQPSLSPDGQWVAFLSRATDLTTNMPVDGVTNAFVRHLPSGRTRLLSEPDLLSGIAAYCYGLAFSADSRYVHFGARLPYGFTNIYQHDLVDGSTRLVCGACQNPAVSGDGRFMAYESFRNSASAYTWIVMVKDMATGHESLISVSTNGMTPARDNYYRLPRAPGPSISRDGRYVLFFSWAADVVATDTNRFGDLFARDRIAGRTYHLTVNTAGNAPANGVSSTLVLAQDGRSAAIQSHAADLASGDYNLRRDVFLMRLAEPDADGDGMDDDWETAYFGTLARDGTGDFEGDGASDIREFQAGTDPTDAGSVFRVIALSEAAGNYRLFWGTEPGIQYQVQFRDNDVDAAGWSNLGPVYTATSTTGSQLVHSATLTTNRFYRVVRLY